MEGIRCLFVIGVFQFLIVVAMIIFTPSVHVQMFYYHTKIINETFSHDTQDVQIIDIGIAFLMIISSFLAMLFISNTFQLLENGNISENDVYSAELLRECGLWDTYFWGLVILVHFVTDATLTTPVNLWAFFLGLILQIHFITNICSPPTDTEGTRSIAKSNLNIAGIFCGYLIILYNVPNSLNNRYIIFFVLLLFDYFLCIGHMWDNCPRMITICNCRLMYTALSPICLAALYGAWNDRKLQLYSA